MNKLKPSPLHLYGFASGIAANNPDCGLGPLYLYYHPELFQSLPFDTEWIDLLMARSEARGADVLPELTEISGLLAEDITAAVKAKQSFCVLGGDHSSAIGTWSGVMNGLNHQDTLGLIWVDAHMDSHTPETSPSQNIHGMPIAHLMGKGFAELNVLSKHAKLLPQNLCLVGIRSFEEGEAALLKNSNVKVFMIDEVLKRGIDAVLQDAIAHLQSVSHIGLTIDLDAFDPLDAPGVGCREAGGIPAADFLKAVKGFHNTPGFVGLEVTELNPLLDEDAKTARLVKDLIYAVYA